MKIAGRKTMFTYAGAASKFGITCDHATPSDARHTTPATTNTTSSIQSFGHPMLKNRRPARMTSVTWIVAFVTAFAAMPTGEIQPDIRVPRIRLSTPCSRRNVMFIASALNVVAMMLMPAIPGTITSRFFWSPLKIAPKSVKNSSGRTKLKNAAVGLRQNIRRSRRYWRQARTAASATGRFLRGELQVDVLERRPRDRQVAQRLVAGQRGRSQLVQQRGGVVGLALLQLAGLVAPGDAIPRGGRGAEFAGRPYGEDRATLDDRHAVGERLRLVEVVRGQQDRLAQLGELADDLPRRAPRGGVEARGRLVEEHKLGVAHQRQPEVQAPGLAARQSADLLVLLAAQPGELEHLVDVARCRIQAAPVLERLADRDVAIHTAALQDDPHPRAQLARALAGVEAEHRDDPARARAVALEDLDGRRLAGAVGAQQAEDLAARDLEVDP